MSQTTETSEITSVRSVETNRESAGVAVAAVLTALARGTFAVARVGAKMTAGATRLAWQGAVKTAEALSTGNTGVQELRPLPVTLRADVLRASSLSAALNALGAAGVRLADAAAIEPLLAKADTALRLGRDAEAKEALATLAAEAESQHQRLIADSVLAHFAAVVRERGFSAVRIVPARGYLLGERANGESVRVDVTRSRDGRSIRSAVDADGFTDDRCIEEVAAIYQGVQQRGVTTQVIRTVRKPRIPLGGKVPGRVAQTL